jgi:dipeptidyl aminopeptidase/acylaminoacyl peptidase
MIELKDQCNSLHAIGSNFRKAALKLLPVLLLYMQPCGEVHAQGATKTVFTTATKEGRRNIITRLFKQQAEVRYIYQTSINPAATAVVWNADGPKGSSEIYFSSLNQGAKPIRVTATGKNQRSNEAEPQWSPNGKEIAFLSDAGKSGQLQVYISNGSTGTLITAHPISKFDGFVSHLSWSPDGNWLSVLYVERASREPSPMAAENRAVGLIDSVLNRDVQRLILINRQSGKVVPVTPPDLYVFEYDWSPDSKQFIYSAAPAPGDDNWYIASLYRQRITETNGILFYKPLRQIALPRWSPDGNQVTFIEGLMSDQGATGGEIFSMETAGDHRPKNLTPDRPSSPSWFSWRPDGSILFTEFVGGSIAVNTLNPANGSTKQLWKVDESIRADLEETSLSIAEGKTGPVLALIRHSWNKLPEVWTGAFGNLHRITRFNDYKQYPMPRSENISWTNEGMPVQGWILYPDHYDSTKTYPMLVSVHGGPAWVTTAMWSSPDFNGTIYTALDYFVFFPNPRGSFGQGEKFTLANRRDWGFGDLRDVISGVDTVITRYKVDARRVGIFGWSYGGSMAMFAVTQTNKFRAAVTGAGAGDWLSYYGQNSIDKWMYSYFGASPYEDPEAYSKCSAMSYIKNVKTPTMVMVGERDGEAPSPQSFQFWHALKELQVPTQLIVYADEGHSFNKFENRVDACVRTLEWFNLHMPPE